MSPARKRLSDQDLLRFADFWISLDSDAAPSSMVRALRALGFSATNERAAAALRGEPMEESSRLVAVIVRLTGEDDIVLKP